MLLVFVVVLFFLQEDNIDVIAVVVFLLVGILLLFLRCSLIHSPQTCTHKHIEKYSWFFLGVVEIRNGVYTTNTVYPFGVCLFVLFLCVERNKELSFCKLLSTSATSLQQQRYTRQLSFTLMFFFGVVSFFKQIMLDTNFNNTSVLNLLLLFFVVNFLFYYFLILYKIVAVFIKIPIAFF